MVRLRPLFRVLLTFVLFLPLLAWAQVVAVPGALDPSDPTAVASALAAAISNKQWALVTALGITALVAGLRRWVPTTNVVGAWLNGKVGGIVSTLVISFGIALVAKLTAGQRLTVALAIDTLGLALAASGGWSIIKNFTEAVDDRAAAKAAAAAATPPVPPPAPVVIAGIPQDPQVKP